MSSRAANWAHQGMQCMRRFVVQAARGFIQQQDAGIVDQSARQGELLQHSGGVFRYGPLPFVPKLQILHQFRYPALGGFFRHARRLCEKQQILLARHMGVWPGACKHHTAHGMDGRRVLCRGTPQHAAFAAGRLCEPAEHADHRCLPCSLRPQKPKHTPLWDMEGQIPHCLDFAICLCELYCCDCFQAAAPFLQSILNIRIKDKGREPRPS